MSTIEQDLASISGTYLPGGPDIDDAERATISDTHFPFVLGSSPPIVITTPGKISWSTKLGIYIPM